MADVFPRTKRSEIMRHVTGTGNAATELKLIQIFRRNGITGWRRKYHLFGRPDFVFPHKRIAVFVDGEFWHGHRKRGQIPATNQAFWIAKIARNRARDRLVNRTLRAAHWTVIRIWQRDLSVSRQNSVVHQIRKHLQSGATMR